MIQLTRLNKTKITINALFIERVESTPDTIITLISGKRLHVLESVEEVTNKVTTYYQQLHLLPILGGKLPLQGGGNSIE